MRPSETEAPPVVGVEEEPDPNRRECCHEQHEAERNPYDVPFPGEDPGEEVDAQADDRPQAEHPESEPEDWLSALADELDLPMRIGRPAAPRMGAGPKAYLRRLALIITKPTYNTETM